jgi:glutathione synthase/RimK-type ligase-like ATP-grasp enzyme/ribosomal protein S20
MADIALLYDRSESDELGIRLTAEQMGVELGYLPFYKVAFGFDRHSYEFRSSGKDYTQALRDARVVLNRGQSKNRRVFAATIMESIGKQVVNPLSVELSCQSKVKSLLAFAANGINIPKTVYVPCNVSEETGDGDRVDNSESISGLIEAHLGSRVVVKPDAGTHGRNVSLANGHEDLIRVLRGVDSGITNPAGVVAQELVDKWFYDLRIIVSKERGKPANCEPIALVRGGFKEFRTNTFLGNMVFHAELPADVRRDAERCGATLAGDAQAWVIAMDAMPRIGAEKTADDEDIKRSLTELETPFAEVTKAKRDPDKKTRFENYSRKVEEAYLAYKATEAYGFVQSAVQESLDRTASRVVFHEGNSCPEFWEQTRIVAGINVAEPLLRSAVSLLDR